MIDPSFFAPVDAKTKKITVTISLIGIFVLLMLLDTMNPSHANLGELTQKDINKKIKVEGKIIEMRRYVTQEKEPMQIVVLQDTTGTQQIILFHEDTILKKEDYIIVIGRVNLYKGKIQIIAEKIIKK